MLRDRSDTEINAYATPPLAFDKRVSAGCEMMAAATPAMTPDERATAMVVAPLALLGSMPAAPQMASAAWETNCVTVPGVSHVVEKEAK